MIRRVRTPDGRNLDVDMGPASARMTQNAYAVSATTGANMMPILKDGGNSIADKGRHAARKAFSIRLENRFNASQLPRKVAKPTLVRCGSWMPRAKVACDRLSGHGGFHTGQDVRERRLAVRRNDRPAA